jgi:hypothetical protein
MSNASKWLPPYARRGAVFSKGIPYESLERGAEPRLRDLYVGCLPGVPSDPDSVLFLRDAELEGLDGATSDWLTGRHTSCFRNTSRQTDVYPDIYLRGSECSGPPLASGL